MLSSLVWASFLNDMERITERRYIPTDGKLLIITRTHTRSPILISLLSGLDLFTRIFLLGCR